MGKRTLLSCFCFVIFIAAFHNTSAQNIRISGTVLAEENDLPVPFATISIPSQRTGTSANDQGKFTLDLSRIKSKDIMIISSIGYQPLELVLSEIDQENEVTFRLKTAVMVLDEQIVTAEALDPKEIVRNASKNLKSNFSSKPNFISSVYSEEIKINGEVVGMMEGYGIAYMSGFNPKNYTRKKQPSDQIQWKHIRRSKYATGEITSYVAAYKLLKAKDRHLYNGPVNESNISKYNYRLDSTTVLENLPVFIISFTSKDNNEIEGRVLIEDESYRLIELQIDNRTEKQGYEKFNKDFKSSKSYFYVSFSAIGNQSFINRIYFTLQSEVGEDVVLTEDLKFISGQFNRTRATRMNEGQLSVLFYEMVNPLMLYSQEYWKNYEPLEYAGKGQEVLEAEFEFNNGKRIKPLPKGAKSYQQMYNDRQLFDLFINEF